MKEILYDWGGANLWLFHAINDVKEEYLDWFMLLGTHIGSHTYFPVYLAIAVLIALVVIALALRKDPRLGQELALYWLAAMCVFILGYTLDGAFLTWLKPFLDFPRPPLALPADSLHILGEPEYHHSLPSGHASFAMLVAASFWPVLNSAGRVAVGTFVVWVGISRIGVGAHFPADILAAYISSLSITLLVRAGIYRVLQLRPRSMPSFSLKDMQ